jgi:hypothetical protein
VIKSLLEEELVAEVVFDIASAKELVLDKNSPSDHFKIFCIGLVRKVSLLTPSKSQMTFESVC